MVLGPGAKPASRTSDEAIEPEAFGGMSLDDFMASSATTLKDQDNFGGWLFGIAHNRANKWYQRQRTKIIKFQEIQRRKAEDAAWRPAEERDGPGTQEIVSQSLQKLPPQVRQVLVLKYLEGQSYDAIEGRLGINFHRIDYLIRKGKALLRSKLKRAAPDLGIE